MLLQLRGAREFQILVDNKTSSQIKTLQPYGACHIKFFKLTMHAPQLPKLLQSTAISLPPTSLEIPSSPVPITKSIGLAIFFPKTSSAGKNSKFGLT